MKKKRKILRKKKYIQRMMINVQQGIKDIKKKIYIKKKKI